jgi:hypothetical protein
MSDKDVRDAARAARRCTTCRSKALCDQWTAEPGLKASPLFCANAVYIDLLRIRA